MRDIKARGVVKNITQLNSQFGIGKDLIFIEGKGGLPFIQVLNKKASALISLYAGQVLSFKPVNEAEEMMFVSSNAYFQENKAIKGGTPICWPWFGDYIHTPSHPAHGFVRNNFWQVVTAACLENGDTQIILEFVNTKKTEQLWSYQFKLSLIIIIGDSLSIELITDNIDNRAFSISEALHSYFKIGNIDDIEVSGLENTDFLDKTDDFSQRHQSAAIKIREETDRIYLNSPDKLIIDDPVLNRKIKIESSGNQNIVVWNPWSNGSATIADLSNNDYRSFICVETANALAESVEVLPRQSHSLKTTYSII